LQVDDLAKTRVDLIMLFTVASAPVVEASHVRFQKWLRATSPLCCSKKGISSRQLHRVLEITFKSAWLAICTVISLKRPALEPFRVTPIEVRRDIAGSSRVWQHERIHVGPGLPQPEGL
jgi:hypothetical protein